MTMTVRQQGSLWDYRGLVWNFAQRDLKARFKGTALGWAWSLVVPLASLVIYTIVFSTIFKGTPPPFGSGRKGNFTVWLLAGLVPWGIFANNLNASIGVLLGAGPLLKKIYFPSYAPVFGSIIATVIQSAIELGILLVVLLILGNVSWTWVLVPLWLLVFTVFTAAVSLILALLNVYFRDLAHIIGVAIQLGFYGSPIIYQLTLIPEHAHGLPLRRIIELNPMTQFIELFRDLTYGLSPGSPLAWGGLVVVTALASGLAVLVYRSRGLDLSEEL